MEAAMTAPEFDRKMARLARSAAIMALNDAIEAIHEKPYKKGAEEISLVSKKIWNAVLEIKSIMGATK